MKLSSPEKRPFHLPSPDWPASPNDVTQPIKTKKISNNLIFSSKQPKMNRIYCKKFRPYTRSILRYISSVDVSVL